MNSIRTLLVALAFGFSFALPLLAVHICARIFVEPAIENSDDCKDRNARPGSRADKSTMMQRG